jgi:hypothetical protein
VASSAEIARSDMRPPFGLGQGAWRALRSAAKAYTPSAPAGPTAPRPRRNAIRHCPELQPQRGDEWSTASCRNASWSSWASPTRLALARRYLYLMLLHRVAFPDFCEPCLPSPAAKPPAGAGWLHEIKHDGFRMLVRRDAAGVRLFTRNKRPGDNLSAARPSEQFCSDLSSVIGACCSNHRLRPRPTRRG